MTAHAKRHEVVERVRPAFGSRLDVMRVEIGPGRATADASAVALDDLAR
jgi:hypothetical protein